MLFPISLENKIRLAWQLDKEGLSPRKSLYMVRREGDLLPGVSDTECTSEGDGCVQGIGPNGLGGRRQGRMTTHFDKHLSDAS